MSQSESGISRNKLNSKISRKSCFELELNKDLGAATFRDVYSASDLTDFPEVGACSRTLQWEHALLLGRCEFSVGK